MVKNTTDLNKQFNAKRTPEAAAAFTQIVEEIVDKGLSGVYALVSLDAQNDKDLEDAFKNARTYMKWAAKAVWHNRDSEPDKVQKQLLELADHTKILRKEAAERGIDVDRRLPKQLSAWMLMQMASRIDVEDTGRLQRVAVKEYNTMNETQMPSGRRILLSKNLAVSCDFDKEKAGFKAELKGFIDSLISKRELQQTQEPSLSGKCNEI